MKIKYVANAVKWFDKINGNTYHSVNITRCLDGEKIYCPFQYGYGSQYQQTALKAMLDNGWLDKKYKNDNLYLFERENEYPIMWNESEGLKRDCISNGRKY